MSRFFSFSLLFSVTTHCRSICLLSRWLTDSLPLVARFSLFPPAFSPALSHSLSLSPSSTRQILIIIKILIFSSSLFSTPFLVLLLYISFLDCAKCSVPSTTRSGSPPAASLSADFPCSSRLQSIRFNLFSLALNCFSIFLFVWHTLSISLLDALNPPISPSCRPIVSHVSRSFLL